MIINKINININIIYIIKNEKKKKEPAARVSREAISPIAMANCGLNVAPTAKFFYFILVICLF